jgi:cytochrome b pre-mRNA-processing protein 3
MFLKWWRQTSPADTIEAIYGAIVAQARSPGFYADFGVPDTVEGRFDMIVLHLFLLLRRIGGRTDERRRLGQALFDRFCGDLDANLREMGVGDLTVPRKMQEFAEAFYGRSAAYERALAAQDREAGSLAIARNIFGQNFPTVGARRLSQYMFAAAAMIDAATDHALFKGRLTFPIIPAVSEYAAGGA